MPDIFNHHPARIARIEGWFQQSPDLVKALFGALLLILLYSPTHLFGTTVSSTFSAGLAWNRSLASSVVGYRIQYGTSSGSYSYSVLLGNVTNTTISGLLGNVAYYFTVSTYDASGKVSSNSGEVRFVPGLPMLQLQLSKGKASLTAKGIVGHLYQVQTTQNLKSWSILGVATPDLDGTLSFSDPNAAKYSMRFYRFLDTTQ